MTIKVLHIFSPDFARQFGGATIRWKFYFSQWNNPDVIHYVLDTSKNQIVIAKEAFDFKFPEIQKGISRWERVVWIFSLFSNLYKYQGKYDVLHVHKLWWGGLLVGPWANLKKIPAIYESVLLESDTPKGIFKEKLSGIKLACLKTYSMIITVSEYLAEDYKIAGFKKEQVTTILNCVDTKLFSPVEEAQQKILLRQKLGLPIANKIILFVGTVIKRKGIDLLVRAFIRASFHKTNLFLLIVGPVNRDQDPGIDTDLLRTLEKELKASGLYNKCRFVGFVQDKHLLSDYLRASDLFAFPSNREGLPNALLEAMSTGLPVIATRIPVLEGTIVHHKNGVFVPAGDITALTEAMLLLANDIALSNELGSCARKHILDIHSFSGWQNRIIGIYKELTKNAT